MMAGRTPVDWRAMKSISPTCTDKRFTDATNSSLPKPAIPEALLRDDVELPIACP